MGRAGAKTVTVLALACGFWAAPACAQQPPKARLETLADVDRAIQYCWRTPKAGSIRVGMEWTIDLTFKSDGEIYGSHITFLTPGVSERERAPYYRALARSIKRCTPLPVTQALGEAIAGRPFHLHYRDVRQPRKD
jgi:hypothetical protein